MEFLSTWQFWVGFTIGLFAGAFIGFFVAALCAASGRASRMEEKIERDEDLYYREDEDLAETLTDEMEIVTQNNPRTD